MCSGRPSNLAPPFRQALSNNNIDMSSTETSGAAPAEAAATTPAPSAPVSFGSSRGSGLSRGKRPAPSGPSKASAPASDYKPTAIEVVQAPREYQNPFAPLSPEPAEGTETPVAASPEATAPAANTETAPAAAPAHRELFPLEDASAGPTEAAEDSKAELNILEPAQQKTAPAQTWESAGFKDDVSDRLAQAEAASSAPEEVDVSSIPPQFLYVRPGVKFVPTPRNWGSSEPRPRRGESKPAEVAKLPESAPAREHAAPSSPGFFGWLKSLFGGAKPAARNGESHEGEHRHHRRHRGGHGEGAKAEHGGEHRERGGRRRRGGRDRGHRRSHGEPQGSRQGGSI